MRKFLLSFLIESCLNAALLGTASCAQDSFELARARIIEETMNRLEREMTEYPATEEDFPATEDLTEIPLSPASDSEEWRTPVDYFNSNQPEDFPGTTGESGKRIQADLQILTGFRQDDFDWNIAGDIQGGSPNILSELTWPDLSMTQIKAKGRILLKDHLVLDGYAAYADIYSGKNQDSDFLGDNRTSEFSRSNNASDDGEAEDLSAGVGYRFFLKNVPSLLEVDTLWLTVLGGVNV